MEEIKRIRCGNVNCFLLTRGETAVLVDTARTTHRQTILDACKPYQVRLILLTHGHVDHVQNAAFLSRTFGCPIAMGEADAELIRDNNLQPLSARGVLGKLVLSASLKSFREDVIEPFTPALFLHEGDSLEEFGFPAKVLSLPGHTKGSIGLDAGEAGVLVGDALMNMFYPTVSMLWHDQKDLLQSAAKLGALGPRLIHFGHGKSIRNRNWI